jgi:RimJ/RimL family protein N-acetyltransferase
MSRKDLTESDLHESIAGGAGDRSPRRPDEGLVIETRRLLLRAPGPADAPAVAELADNPRVAQNLVGMPHPYRIADALAWIDEEAPPGGQKHLVCLKSVDGPPTVIGAVTLDHRRGARLPTLGCWLGERHWGRGYSTEAAHAVIDYAFLHQGHERLSFTCRVTNGAGRRVIEKCGFQWAAQELGQSAFHNAVVPVDRFQLDRRTWEGLRRWEPLRFAAGGRNPQPEPGLGGREAAEV